jgi:hypothetical protein
MLRFEITDAAGLLAYSGFPAMENMIGNTIERLLADAGYRGHNAPADYKFRLYTLGQKRRLTPQIKWELRRRAAIEPVISHLKAEHRMWAALYADMGHFGERPIRANWSLIVELHGPGDATNPDR